MTKFVNPPKEVMDEIKTRRKAAKVGQASAAKLLGITQGCYSKLESGKQGAYVESDRFDMLRAVLTVIEGRV